MNHLYTNLKIIVLTFLLYTSLLWAGAQEQTVGLFINDPLAFDGYTLFSPNAAKTTYLIDMEGKLVHQWNHDYTPSQTVYLLENGHLLRATSIPSGSSTLAGGFQEIDWDGTVLWEYNNDDQHHDIEALPNGHVLVITNETKTRTEAIEAGRDPDQVGSSLQVTVVLEVAKTETGSEVVWEWHLWDHLIQDFDASKDNFGDVAAHPELMDINYMERVSSDWNHTNSIDYNEGFDQIILSNRSLNDIWVIDHSTTTSEAAGHTGGRYNKGGDILYRWGNPVSYRAGTENDQMLFEQHDAHWIEEGNPGAGHIMIFNNGVGRLDAAYSTVDEIIPPVDANGNYTLQSGSAYGPSSQTWQYMADNPTDFYASRYSGAQRLPNGNTLICSGTNGTFFEITSENDIVWKYINPVDNGTPVNQGDTVSSNDVFRCYRYAPDYPGLAGKDLTPGDPIEHYPSVLHSGAMLPNNRVELADNFPNPFNPSTVIRYNLSLAGYVNLSVYNTLGQTVRTLVLGEQQPGNHTVVFDAQNLPGGLYFYRLVTERGQIRTKKMLLLR